MMTHKPSRRSAPPLCLHLGVAGRSTGLPRVPAKTRGEPSVPFGPGRPWASRLLCDFDPEAGDGALLLGDLRCPQAEQQRCLCREQLPGLCGELGYLPGLLTGIEDFITFHKMLRVCHGYLGYTEPFTPNTCSRNQCRHDSSSP